MEWTDERVAALKELNAEGLTGSQIAIRLGGCTRNAVIGKLNRLGVRPSNPPCHNQPRIYADRAPRPPRAPRQRTRSGPPPGRQVPVPDVAPFLREPAPIPIETYPEPLLTPLEAVTSGQCRYIVADHPARFCGLPTSQRGHGTYCARHADACYAGLTRREG